MSNIIWKDLFVGTEIFGFCNGFFGRDSYDDKIIIANGEDWIVTKDAKDIKEFATFENIDEMCQMINQWRQKEEF
jgi:hypothetical protein